MLRKILDLEKQNIENAMKIFKTVQVVENE